MDIEFHHNVIRSIRSSFTQVVELDGAYLATVVFPKADEYTKGLLSECFNVLADVDAFCIVVCDNGGRPLGYPTQAAGVSASMDLHATLERKYTFFCYREYGYKISVPQEVTISFFKRKSHG